MLSMKNKFLFFLRYVCCFFLIATLNVTSISLYAQDWYQDSSEWGLEEDHWDEWSDDGWGESDDFSYDSFDSSWGNQENELQETKKSPKNFLPESQSQTEETPSDLSGDYVDEELIPENPRTRIQFNQNVGEQMRKEEREHLQANLMYGAGTGFMLGSWFAFVLATNTREFLRTIGTSVVLGTVVGSALGSRSVWNPDGPTPIGKNEKTSPSILPLITAQKLQIRWELKF